MPVTEIVPVHFEDLDAMGIVHNARYVLLLERALSAYWTRAGWPFSPGEVGFEDALFVVREFSITYHAPITKAGEIGVELWLERLGSSSATYGFRVVSPDRTVLHAEGRRVQVRLDPQTLRPARIGDDIRAACEPLLLQAA
jgi:acyl-CoA thioester hydrolase